ncbi:MAG TPA: hypothetical protein PKD53_25770 [Chloroflexaceae bacterium]|nr:hypothetical protein [Chloroflexaceae bacterium]
MSASTYETPAITEETARKRYNDHLVGGAVMLFAGLLLLVGQLFTLGSWLLILISLGFVAAGLLTRGAGWFIPGGIVGGIGLGALLLERGLVAGDSAEGGLFLLAFALGWASIYLLTRLFTRRPQSWALIPGGILALIGGALLMGEAGAAALGSTLQILAYAWPLALIAGGLLLIARARRR